MSPARVHLILLLLRIGIGALSLNLMDNSITFSKRASHSTFFKDRDWPAVTTLWRYLMKQEWATTNLPTVDQEIKFTNFEVTNLDTIHKIGLTEYSSADPRYKRKTFAMRIGYDGSSYNGYQSQKGSIGVRTVEEELFDALGGRTCCAAGRTDGDVSAISQIICFSTYDEVTPESLLINVAASEAAQSERLRVFECVRAPRRFHSLFGATWRRYLYVMPLNKGTYDGGVDVDVAFVNAALRRLEGRKLPYNAFAYREDRAVDQTDHCTLYCARAFLVHLDSPSTVERVESVDSDTQFESVPMGLCVELVGDRFLRRMVRILVVCE